MYTDPANKRYLRILALQTDMYGYAWIYTQRG